MSFGRDLSLSPPPSGSAIGEAVCVCGRQVLGLLAPLCDMRGIGTHRSSVHVMKSNGGSSTSPDKAKVEKRPLPMPAAAAVSP